ncbi:hypothetical protein P8C59_000595 [Phyllachora maydis]|uniref:Uncharacterized protein n=1 Tax=Phyllachora maydis TaxID=1825666 RepID=A0AAD9MBD1_9PEZI|nr:hypothetical protein P8C59_000595 [Phyllachora maydis]
MPSRRIGNLEQGAAAGTLEISRKSAIMYMWLLAVTALRHQISDPGPGHSHQISDPGLDVAAIFSSRRAFSHYEAQLGGCGEILEEGKAFELAGNRWHLDCFRCHTCNTLLDSDANLLLLGDGSLICNNCTYSCSACGNKIEDLAILTGDQAFCATCFRCRNCKRKIENLRYARTSQGIFCMSCHESLMARRRKKSKSTATSGSKSRDKDASPMITDKSLPALPPNAVPLNAFSNDRVDADSDTPTELSPRPRASYQTSDAVQPTSSRTSRSLERASESGIDAAVTLPATSYRNNRNSSIIPGDLSKRDEDGFLISLGLDHSPANSVTPRLDIFCSIIARFANARSGRHAPVFRFDHVGASWHEYEDHSPERGPNQWLSKREWQNFLWSEFEGRSNHNHGRVPSPIAEDPGREISSNMALPGGTGHEDPALLKRQLKNSEQRVAELERQFGTEKDLKNLNKKLLEKRKTVSVLDSQTEIMIRQLEVLAGYVERAKKTNEPLDARELEDSAIKEFVQKLDRVKQSMAAQIEQLHAERDELLEEKTQAVAERERALLEFEQLSSKNAQLADMNNEMTHQIQERFKQQLHHGHDMKSANNGLGIYSHAKGASSASVNLDAASLQTGSTMVGNTTDLEEPAVLEQGPTVVNIRKGQVKKFNWKKGTSKVAHNFSKGINRAAGAFQQPQQPDQPRNHSLQGLTGDNIGLPYNMTVAQVEAPVSVVAAQQQVNGQIRSNSDNSRQGFGFFGKKTPAAKSTSMGNVALTPAAAEAPSTLFGSDLVERADFERRQIPSVVQRCIEEVELRGMDVEGIYRKTGGNSQVKMIQEGFDKSEDFDISDPGLDITAVTSVLKQYFRKLPNPLLTFDVYERILESNAVQSESDRCVHLRQTINMLPAKHRDCLEFLMFHLARVADRERENLMSPKNLAVVFAPTIMRDHSLEKEMTDMHAKNLAVQFIIENSHIIFGDA